MPIYKYKAVDKAKNIRQGFVDAVSDDHAAETLQDKDFSVISIKEVSLLRNKSFANLTRVKIKDIVIFSRQFSVMMSASVAIVQALKILVEQTVNVKLKEVISDIADEVDSGSKLSDSLSKRPKIFSEFYVSVVRSGETSGKLDEVLNYLADEMEKDYDMTSKIKGAMMYPAFVLSGLVVVGMIMMIYVLPKMLDIFTDTGVELPLATKILIATSDFFVNYWIVMVISFFIFFIFFKFYIKKPIGRRQFDFIKLKIPIFGKLFQRIYLVRFARSMHTLIVGGVTISNSLKISSDVVGNRIYQDLINRTIKEVEEGNSISSVFIESDEIPKMVSQMMSIGEKTGKLDIILERITEFYGREISNTLANLMTLLEPVIMIIMGVAVGFMVAAIIMPMYNLSGAF